MDAKYNDAVIFLITAAAALLGACGAPPAAAPTPFTITHRGAPVGWVTRLELGRRADADGPFLLAKCELRLRVWADGRGVQNEALELVAARRPGRPVYYIRGRWPGGEFWFRRGAAWRLIRRGVFGNAAASRGVAMPVAFTFRGIPLPLTASAPPPGSGVVTTLELTDGTTRTWLGRGDGRRWNGTDAGDHLRVSFGPGGEVENAVGSGGLVLAAAAAPIAEETSFVYQRPPIIYLPYIIGRGPAAARLELPLTVALSPCPSANELARAASLFDGEATGRYLSGTFTFEAAAAAPLRSPGAGLDDDAEQFALTPWGTWPMLAGEGELTRMAAAYRAEGKRAAFVTGLGLFAGNLVAPYSWLEVEGEAVAAPGRPTPTARVPLAVGERSLRITKLSWDGEANFEGGRRRRSVGATPALAAGTELSYRIFYRGSAAGRITARVEEEGTAGAVVRVRGDVFGAPFESTQTPVFSGLGPAPAGPSALAALVALGPAVATADEGTPPPYEFCFPLAARRAVARVRWRGVKAVVAGRERRLCRSYEVTGGTLAAYYTYDGVLARLEQPPFRVDLEEFPVIKKRPAFVEAVTAPPATAPAEEPPAAAAAEDAR